jgi:hypothetical protein
MGADRAKQSRADREQREAELSRSRSRAEQSRHRAEQRSNGHKNIHENYEKAPTQLFPEVICSRLR